MREYSPMLKGFAKGLKPYQENPRDSDYMYECMNCAPSRFGLKPTSAVTIANSDVAQNWPFPQVFRCRERNVVIVLEDDGKIDLYEMSSTGTMTVKLEGMTHTTNTTWDVLDFGEYIIATNGAQIATYDDANGWQNISCGVGLPRFTTGCNLKGQIVAGRVTAGDDDGCGSCDASWYDCDNDFAIWSRIGNIIFTPDKSGVPGYKPTWTGGIRKIKRLGDAVIVYGDSAICALIPVSEPMVTFKRVELLNIGLLDNSSVAGDVISHAFIDENGTLWTIDAGLKLEKQGFKWLFSSWTTGVIIVLDTKSRDFYISNSASTGSYIFTPYGMGRTSQAVTGMISSGTGLIGFFQDTEDDEYRIVTDVYDFGVRGFKNVGMVDVGGDTGEVNQDLQVALDYRNNKTAAFTRTSYVKTNDRGWAYPNVSAHEFRFCVKAAAFSGVNIDYIQPHVKFVDKHNVRGPYGVSETSA